MRKHPLEFVPLHLRKPLFYIFLVLTFVIFGVLNVLDKPLRNPISPNGIVSLELAFTPERAKAIIFVWNYASPIELDNVNDSNPFFEMGFIDGYSILPLHYLFFGLGFDYLFMPVYALTLSLGLLLAGHEKVSWFRTFTAWLGWGVFAAAMFDALENYMLWRLLIIDVVSPYPEIATLCAIVKFTLLSFGLVTIIAGKVIKHLR